MEKLVYVALIITMLVVAFSFYQLGRYELAQELCNKNQYEFCEVDNWRIK